MLACLVTLLFSVVVREVLVIVYGPVAWLLLVLLVGVLIWAATALVEAWRRFRRDDPLPSAALRWRITLYAAFLCTAYLVVTPPVRFWQAASITAVLFYGVTLAIQAALPWLRRILPQRLRRMADVTLGNVVLLVVLAEVALQGVAVFWSTPLLVTAQSSGEVRRSADRRAPGTLHVGFPMNERGHYDTEVATARLQRSVLVASIGDSFSYGVVPHARHFTTLAEQRLPDVEIYNMGFPGTGPVDYLHLVQDEAVPLDPDLIVIQLFLGNDLSDTAPETSEPRWYERERYLLPVALERAATLWKVRKSSDDAVPRPADAETEEDPLRHFVWFDDPMLEQPSFPEDIFLGIETRNMVAVCGPDDAIYERFFGNFERILEAVGDIPVAAVLIPSEAQVEDHIWEAVRGASDQPLVRDRPQRELARWFSERGVPFLDLLPVLESVEPLADGRQHVFHLQDTHFNARGNAVSGTELARFVSEILESGPSAQGRTANTTGPRFSRTPAELTLRHGWQEPEPTHLWSDGPVTTFRAQVSGPTDVTMRLDVQPYPDPDAPAQRIAIDLNGSRLEQVVLPPERSTVEIRLPGDRLGPAPAHLAIRYAWTRRPAEHQEGADDMRELAVAWYDISFDRTGEAVGAVAPHAEAP